MSEVAFVKSMFSPNGPWDVFISEKGAIQAVAVDYTARVARATRETEDVHDILCWVDDSSWEIPNFPFDDWNGKDRAAILRSVLFPSENQFLRQRDEANVMREGDGYSTVYATKDAATDRVNGRN